MIGMHGRFGHANDSTACTHYKAFWLYVATLFPGMLGGLGLERCLLCRDRDLSALCHHINSMLRHGFGLGQAWVTTRASLCRDRFFPRAGHSYRDTVSKGGVATGFFFFFCRDP